MLWDPERIVISSFSFTRKDGMFTFFPFTRICPWVTSWRACARLFAHAQTVHYVIQTAFQQHQQVFTRYALHAASLLEVPAELSFQYAIGTARFLLLAQLNAILALFFAANAMLSRGRGAFYNRTFRSKTTIPLKEELCAFPAALPANRICISCHLCFLLLILDAAAFRRTASIVRNGCRVLD